MSQKKNSWKDYALLHIVLFLYSLGAIFSKVASRQEFLSWRFIMAYGMVLVIMFAYAIVWQQVLKKIDLTVAFANKAIVIAWGIIWGAVLFKEQITWNMIVGAVIIIIGIWMVVRENEC